MMRNFTQFINESVWTIERKKEKSAEEKKEEKSAEEKEEEEPAKEKEEEESAEERELRESLEFLNAPSNFRPFSEGLRELLDRCDYPQKDGSPEEKAAFVLQKFKDAEIKISKQTVKDWFLGVRRPDTSAKSRTKMYQLCFALHTSYKDICWFFHHVYLGRCFNCHVIEEAVYLYCFKNGYDYQKAEQLISRISNIDFGNGNERLYTNEIEDSIQNISNDDELIEFFSQNADSFGVWNVSAKNMIKRLLEDIKGAEVDKIVLDQLKKDIRMVGYVRIDSNKYQLSNCGLITKEIFHTMQGTPELLLDKISGIDTSELSYDFILDHIFDAKGTVKKTAILPEIVRTNFPGRTSFQMINTILTSNSYDSIRKFLIFLKFYHFWCNWKLNPPIAECPYDLFLDEMNDLLYQCGYDDLFAGNPYDWLFMKASTMPEPLDFFRDAMGEILNDD